MKEELLYLFVQGLTSPEESRDVIHYAASNPDFKTKLLEEKKMQDVLIWCLPAEAPEQNLHDFLELYANKR